MKIIDLLNKIANGEVPKKIKVDNRFIYIHDGIDYKSHDGKYLFDSYLETTTEDMNIEIEIIEDTLKKDKKIEPFVIGKIVDDELQGLVKSINLCNKEIQDKINELIDKATGE